MRMRLVKSEALLEFHIDGSNEMSAELLAQSIYNMASLTQAVALQENPEAFVKVNVVALKDGCFQVDFRAIIESTAPFVIASAPKIIDFANKAVSLVTQSFELRKHLNGKKPSKVSEDNNGTSAVFNNKGDVYYFNGDVSINLANEKINESISKVVDAVKTHNPNGGFVLKSNDTESIFGAADFNSLISAPVIEDITTRTYTKTVLLEIRRPDLVGHSPWGFMLEGKNISARIADGDWMDKLHNHQIYFSSGDCINASLRAEIILNPDGTTDNKPVEYTVVKVIGDVISTKDKSEQCEL